MPQMFSRSFKQPATSRFFGIVGEWLLFAGVGIKVVQAFRRGGEIQSELETAFANSQRTRTEATLWMKRIRTVGDGFGNRHLVRLHRFAHRIPMVVPAERRRRFDSSYGEQSGRQM